jgi:hypothetical protein
LVTKLLHRHCNREIAEFSNKKRRSMERYLKFKEINIFSPFFLLTQSIKINDNFINIHNLVVIHLILYSFSDVSSRTKQYK